MKVYDVANVQIVIDGVSYPHAAVSKLEAGPEAAAALDANRDCTITMTQEGKGTMDALLGALRDGHITTEQALGALTPHIDPLPFATDTPRGSWFAYPMHIAHLLPAIRRSPAIRLSPVLEDWRARQLEDPSPERVKTWTYLRALDVVCVSCGESRHFGRTEDSQYGGDLLCLNCTEPLWPAGGFTEAFTALQLTGDFDAFQTMLRCPPPETK